MKGIFGGDVILTLKAPPVNTETGSEVIKVFFMLNSTELEISTAHKHSNTDKEISCSKSLSCCIYYANKC